MVSSNASRSDPWRVGVLFSRTGLMAVTETYDKYDMLKEKKAVVKILSDEIRRIVGVGPTERDARVHQGSVP